ncbi:MAG: hypothetical protein WB820_15875, partial [Rhodoplanes sp.]
SVVPDRKPLNPSNCRGVQSFFLCRRIDGGREKRRRKCRNTSGLGQSGGNLHARNGAGVAGKEIFIPFQNAWCL